MGTILASAIISSLRITLLDPAPGKTWTDARLLALMNEALRRMVCVKPEVYPLQSPLTLAIGAEQQLPAGGTQLFKLVRNVVSRKPINQVSESLLIEENRWLTAATYQVDVSSFSLDERDGTRYTITPPNDGTGSVLAFYGGTPSVATVGTAIPIDDLYEGPLKFMTLAEAYAADTTRQDLSKSQANEAHAMQLLGFESTGKTNSAPKLGKPGGS